MNNAALLPVTTIDTIVPLMQQDVVAPKRKYIPAIVRDLVRTAEKENNLLYFPPRPAIRFNRDKTFNLNYFVDLRWGKFEWQKQQYALERMWTGKTWKVFAKKLPRRHGKTHYEVFSARDYLIQVPLPRPVGAYYCPVKGQAIRNAWDIFKRALSPIPGAKIEEAEGKMTFPRPTLADPTDYVTIWFFGVVGGSGSKRGGYYDIAIFDEVEYINQGFVEEVGFGSTLDRDGIVRLLGTPAGHGRLDYWLGESRKREVVRKALAMGQKVSKQRMTKDVHEWNSMSKNCYDLKVYPHERLMRYKAIMTAEKFAQEFECNDQLVGSGFYHRGKVEVIRNAGNISLFVKYNPHFALRAHFDLGLGSKSDRMAFCIDQYGKDHINFLWGQDVLEKGYFQAATALRESKYGNCYFFEIVIPHDGGTAEQSDGISRKIKFEEALKRAGVKFGDVRVLFRSKDKLMDTKLVTALLDKCLFHEVDSSPLVEALENHKRRWNKTAEIWEEEPSKTKFRDRADCVRAAVVDFDTGQYTKAVSTAYGHIPASMQSGGDLERFSGKTKVGIAEGFHPSEGSVIINHDGSMKESAYNGGYVGNQYQTPQKLGVVI